jgi:hypothetical protein
MLAKTLAEQVVPRLERLQGLEAQCAAVDGTGPDADTFRKSVWGRVLVRLGRVPRAEVEDLLDRLGDREFSAMVRSKLDSIYPE